MRIFKKYFLGIFYAIFVLTMIATHSSEHAFMSNGPYAAGKYIIWLIFIALVAYSVYCNSVENFFRSVKKINQYHREREIRLDLYISMFLNLFLIYFNEVSIMVVLIWSIPVLIFANMAMLLYIALNYDSLISHFV